MPRPAARRSESEPGFKKQQMTQITGEHHEQEQEFQPPQEPTPLTEMKELVESSFGGCGMTVVWTAVPFAQHPQVSPQGTPPRLTVRNIDYAAPTAYMTSPANLQAFAQNHHAMAQIVRGVADQQLPDVQTHEHVYMRLPDITVSPDTVSVHYRYTFAHP